MTRTTRLSTVLNRPSRSLVAILCAALIAPGETVFLAQAATPGTAQAATAQAAAEAPKLPPEQLDALVAPIALYPDPLLGQVLVASTYPLEIVQLQQWLAKNPGLKDKALADAVAKQPWDPSIQSMAALPDAVKRLGDDIQWTTELGNAFLAQQSDVMDAVQRMRKKAEGTGALKTNEQQKVETKVVEQKTVIVVEPANPEVIYVPAYNPVVVYGPPVYAYPPIYYPPYPSTGAIVATGMITFGVGLAIGAAWGHGGYGYGCGWVATTSTSTSTTTSTGTPTSIAAATRTGVTTPSTAAALRMGTRPPPASTAGRLAGAAAQASGPSRRAEALEPPRQAGPEARAPARQRPLRAAQAAPAEVPIGPEAGTSDRAGARVAPAPSVAPVVVAPAPGLAARVGLRARDRGAAVVPGAAAAADAGGRRP